MIPILKCTGWVLSPCVLPAPCTSTRDKTRICCILHAATQAVELPLMLAQTAAIMEVLHSVVGLVRSPVAITGEAGLETVLTAEGGIITISGESGQRLERKALVWGKLCAIYKVPISCLLPHIFRSVSQSISPHALYHAHSHAGCF